MSSDKSSWQLYMKFHFIKTFYTIFYESKRIKDIIIFFLTIIQTKSSSKRTFDFMFIFPFLLASEYEKNAAKVIKNMNTRSRPD